MNYPYPRGTIVYFLNKDAESFICELKGLFKDSVPDFSVQKWVCRIHDIRNTIGPDEPMFISAVWYREQCDFNEIRIALTYDQKTKFYNIDRYNDESIYNYIVKNYNAINFGWGGDFEKWNGYDLVEYIGEQIEDLKTDFSERVHEGDFNRLPYKYWTKLFNSNIERLAVFFVPHQDAVIIAPYVEGKCQQLIELPCITEWSLGRYLYELNFVDWDVMPDEDMTTLSSACNYYSDSTTGNTAVNARYCDSNVYPDTWNSTSDVYVSLGDTKRSVSGLIDTIDETKQKVQKLEKAVNKFGESLYQEKPDYMKEKNNMTITNSNSFAKSLNLDFGTCEKDNVKMSPYGLAVKNANGTWVSYDAKSGSIMDVEILNFDCGKYLFKMPVAINDIKAGDVVIHNRVPVFVKGVKDGSIEAVDIVSGSVQVILPTKNMFGFNYATKVVSLVDFSKSGASADNPFGNILPFMLLADGNANGSDLLPLMFMNGANGVDMSNPLMLYALCGSGTKGADFLPVMLLAQSMNGANTPKAAN